MEQIFWDFLKTVINVSLVLEQAFLVQLFLQAQPLHYHKYKTKKSGKNSKIMHLLNKL